MSCLTYRTGIISVVKIKYINNTEPKAWHGIEIEEILFTFPRSLKGLYG